MYKKLIIRLLKFIINEKKYNDNDLLNDYLKYNYRIFKINEMKLYINNIYICKIGFFSFYIYKQIYDVNYKKITKIKDINLDNIKIEEYNYDGIKDALKINLYTYLYDSNKTIRNSIHDKVINIPSNDILYKKETSYSIINQSSTVLNEDELNVLDWLNN